VEALLHTLPNPETRTVRLLARTKNDILLLQQKYSEDAGVAVVFELGTLQDVEVLRRIASNQNIVISIALCLFRFTSISYVTALFGYF